jgi:tetratricopeptide (TPR) repeat protein
MKKFLMIATMAFAGLNASAQNDGCAVNYSIYKEFLNVESYHNAVNMYRQVFNDCPSFSKTVYVDGVKIYKGLIGGTQDKNLINAYVDTIKIIYNQRIANYGEEASVLSRMAYDVQKFRKSDTAYLEAYHIYAKSIALSGENAEISTVSAYFQLAANLYAKKAISSEELFNALVPNILNIRKNYENGDDKYKEQADKVLSSINKNLSRFNNYQADFDKLFDAKYTLPASIEEVANLSKVMSDVNCEGSKLYAETAEKLYKENPGTEAAIAIARYNKKNQQYDKAAEYYAEALNSETDSKKRSNYLYEAALVANYQKKYTQAIGFAKKSLELNSENAAPYMLIGAIYGSNAGMYASDEFMRREIYWVAADYISKAKRMDSSLEEQANALLKKYTVLFPGKEDAFMHSVKPGDVVTLKLVENETTTARF